jgi:NhaA family Na+:H+ antiporter
MAAIGGAIIPACLYIFIHAGFVTVSGWGIPMATDIAFSLGLLSLLGRNIPSAMRVFLATLAIADDVLAILVIALFYSGRIDWSWLVSATLLCVCLWLVRRKMPEWGFLIGGLLLWFLVERSGVHTVMAGVVLAGIIPLMHRDGRGFGDRWLGMLEPWATYGIVPLFALANAGVVFGSDWLDSLTSGVSLAIVIGLILGKQIGIIGVAWLAVHFRFAVFARGFGWRHLYVLSWLAGIGFTASLFVAGLAFGQSHHFIEAKLGILTASIIAGIGGFLAGRILLRKV